MAKWFVKNHPYDQQREIDQQRIKEMGLRFHDEHIFNTLAYFDERFSHQKIYPRIFDEYPITFQGLPPVLFWRAIQK